MLAWPLPTILDLTLSESATCFLANAIAIGIGSAACIFGIGMHTKLLAIYFGAYGRTSCEGRVGVTVG